MRFGEAIKNFFQRYMDFSGRSTGAEFWQPSLLVLLLGIALGPILQTETILALFLLGVVTPQLSSTWRRLHDTGRAGSIIIWPLGIATLLTAAMYPVSAGADRYLGFFIFAAVIFFISAIVLIGFWLTRPSQPGPNRYGPNPLEVTP